MRKIIFCANVVLTVALVAFFLYIFYERSGARRDLAPLPQAGAGLSQGAGADDGADSDSDLPPGGQALQAGRQSGEQGNERQTQSRAQAQPATLSQSLSGSAPQAASAQAGQSQQGARPAEADASPSARPTDDAPNAPATPQSEASPPAVGNAQASVSQAGGAQAAGSQASNAQATDNSIGSAQVPASQSDGAQTTDAANPAASQPATAPSPSQPTAAPSGDSPEPAAEKPPPASPGKPLAGKIVAIDPGHQQKQNSDKEPVAPNSSVKKAKVTSGTAGAATGTAEYIITLDVGLKLRDLLVSQGATVVMTRDRHDVDVSNVERAKIGNDAGADIAVRLHADGSADSSVKGISMLVPSADYVGRALADTSAEAGSTVLSAVISKTGAKNRGVVKRDDMTGFNWSTVPCILIEMGFMSNADEDRLLNSPEYQDKLAHGLCDGIAAFLVGG
ncbi:MAG: N-acetylmuramoyl-L-alanine amidase [Clostridiales bacterium]|jgi:N-acetylmuramoyl-L-alanine amidase|nr:N-acetylmuramoyl-L-alanine amidase [Clostridiales bacterium]